jgi:predicted DNA-binding transcriptional regulator AlpA
MSDLAHRRLRTPAAANYLGYAESTLEKKRLTGDGPPFIKLGGLVVYDTRDLDAWLAARRATSTSERPATPEPGRPHNPSKREPRGAVPAKNQPTSADPSARAFPATAGSKASYLALLARQREAQDISGATLRGPK